MFTVAFFPCWWRSGHSSAPTMTIHLVALPSQGSASTFGPHGGFLRTSGMLLVSSRCRFLCMLAHGVSQPEVKRKDIRVVLTIMARVMVVFNLSMNDALASTWSLVLPVALLRLLGRRRAVVLTKLYSANDHALGL